MRLQQFPALTAHALLQLAREALLFAFDILLSITWHPLSFLLSPHDAPYESRRFQMPFFVSQIPFQRGHEGV